MIIALAFAVLLIFNGLMIIEAWENRWQKLRKMIEKTIVALNENAKDPTDEFITTSVGTFGRVLNMMDELEGKVDKDD